MKIFVGFGYNQRDGWIEQLVFPLLEALDFAVVHGKDLHGQVLKPQVQDRIRQSDVVVGFLTQRDGQGDADFTSHIWVRDELVYAEAQNKPILPVREDGVMVPDGLLGNIGYISLDQKDRLACVVELVKALGRQNIRRINLKPTHDDMRRDMHKWYRDQNFVVRYRTRNPAGVESAFREGRLDKIDQGFYLSAAGVPRDAYFEVEGVLKGNVEFSSGWASADAVQVEVS